MIEARTVSYKGEERVYTIMAVKRQMIIDMLNKQELKAGEGSKNRPP